MKLNSNLLSSRLGAVLSAVCLLAFGAQAATNSVSQLWTQRYNSTNNVADNLNAMALDGSGNVIVTGNSGDYPDYDIYTAKYAAGNGALLWEKRHHNLIGSSSGAAVAVDRSGNVIVTGSSSNDFYTAKYAAADGALLWEKRYNGPLNRKDYGSVVLLDTNDNVVVVGGADYAHDEDYNTISLGFYMAKYAATNGALMWEQTTSPVGQFDARAAAVDAAGNIIVTGKTAGDYSSIHAVKYAGTNGTMLWEHTYISSRSGAPMAMALDPAGNVVIAGSTSGGLATQDDYYTAKYAAADGALLWEKRYNGPINWEDNAQAVAVDKSGNVVVTGSSRSADGYDYYTAKYAAADGALLWEKRYNSGVASTVVLDDHGNAIVSGHSSSLNYDFHTIKYAATDGAVLWEKRFNGANDGSEFMSYPHTAVSPSGLVVVSGSGGDDYQTVVYRETLAPLALARGTNGVFQVSFTGAPGLTCRLERATVLNGPWETVASSLTGVIQFSDTNSPAAQVFYRVAQP